MFSFRFRPGKLFFASHVTGFSHFTVILLSRAPVKPPITPLKLALWIGDLIIPSS